MSRSVSHRPATGPRGGWARAAQVAALLLLAGSARGAPPPGAVPPPAPLPDASPVPAEPLPLPPPPLATAVAEPPPASPRLLEEADGVLLGTWLDLPHAFLERRMFSIVNAFDRFFADERDLGTGNSTSLLRWRNDLTVGEDGSLEHGTSVRADLSLPYIRKRLRRIRILLESVGRGAADEDPAALSGVEERGRTDAVVRFSLLETLRSSIDVGGGVIFDLPPGVVGRLRFRRTQELGPVALARVAATGFWNSIDGFGAKGTLGLERALWRPLLLRWTTGTLVSQSSAGFESASEVALLATLGRATGVTLLGSATSESRPDLVVTKWRVATRLRTDLYRGWIFGEIEPEVTWPLDEAGRRFRTSAVIFRVDLQFEDTSASNSAVAAGRQGGQSAG